MKVRPPKTFDQLSRSDKDKINQIIDQEAERRANHHLAECQKIWLKMACIVLHRGFGFGKDRCLLFLANWKEMYKINSKIKTKEEQTAYLAAAIDEIFHGGYPETYIDKLEEL